MSDEDAAFTVVGAIALQGIRLAQPTLGECFVVTGLGLIGLVAVQILRANGCRVLGLDFDPAKLELAKKYGAEIVNLAEGQDSIAAAEAFSRGRGVDGVIRSEEHTSELQSRSDLVCRLLLEKKKKKNKNNRNIIARPTGKDVKRHTILDG